MPSKDGVGIDIDTYGYDEAPDDEPPPEDAREYDDDDPRRYGWRGRED